MEPQRQQSQKETSLAWFKLADLIARGEREKALNVFRLLSHSLPDRAYVLQLEGDILWHLDDDKNSYEKYKQAAFLYQKEKRWIDAIAIYEHLLTQNPDSPDIVGSLLVFYAVIDWQEKFQERFGRLMKLFKKGDAGELQVEKIIQDVIDIVGITGNKCEKRWLFDWLSEVVDDLPEAIATRLRGLL